MALLDTLIAFIPMLGILIFIHEFGHFVVAKACGVRVLTFSLGFGPAIGFGDYRMRWERGGTEYVIAWIPLGGFVKMLGENLQIQGEEPEPEVVDAQPDEFLNAKNLWQKLAITFAGPAMNLVFPVVILVASLMIGMPRGGAVIGTVEPDSPAAVAGLRAGDRLVSIDGAEMRFWDDVNTAIRSASGGALAIEAERGGEPLSLRVPVSTLSGMSDLGTPEARGWIGVQHHRLLPLVGVPDSDSVAARAGLRSGDLVQRVGDEEIGDWNTLAKAFEAAQGAPLTLHVQRGNAESPETVVVELPASGELSALGMIPAAVLVAKVEEGSAAADAGLMAEDLLLAVDGRTIGSFRAFRETVLSSEGRELAITYARKGEVHEVGLTPRLVSRDSGVANMKLEIYQVGIAPYQGVLRGAVETEQYTNPFAAIPRASELAWDKTLQFLRSFSLMFSGNVGMDSLAGPIGIAQIARDSLDVGWDMYFNMMMLISINLGILNLMPIPVLDGGQALIYIVEGVKRAPLSMRTRELVQSFGLVMVLMLMSVAIGNDLMRNWSSWFGWLRGEP